MALTLWKGNRTDAKWSIKDSELIQRFCDWPRRNEVINWRGLEYALRLFITDPAQLNSSFEEEHFQAFMRRTWRVLREKIFGEPV